MEQNVKERYVDGIGKIHFIGGVIRFDLYSFQPVEAEDGKSEQTPEPIIAERLIMSPNGFLASYDAMVNMINKLTEAGVIQKRDDAAENTTSTTEEKAVEPEVIKTNE